MTKPDFIIIGAMKSATSTIHTQLNCQPGIFMTDPKEPYYFSDDDQYARGEEWYNSLFENAQADDICGESSTHYTKMPHYPLTLERMSKRLKDPKFIYVMRHPIDRVVSHYIHQWSQNVFKCDINQAIDEYEELKAYSCYSMQLEPYINQYGRENILPIFNEALRVDSQKQLAKIAHFIGYTGEVKWQEETTPQNVSNERIREFPGYSWIVDSKLMTQVRQNLLPQSFRDKIKSKFRMQERPVINDEHIKELTAYFNKDLAQLGQWFDIDLNCENFKETVKNTEFIWKS
jgi:hypothetical protein